MTIVQAVVVDVIAIAALVFGVYFRRHRRRDMLLAYTLLNIGVLSVAIAMSSATLGLGLGLGIFGVLSIIRLRSWELTQEEVAYYLTALAIGLVAGVRPSPSWLAPALAAAMVAVAWVVDHPALLQGYRQQILTLDAAYTDEAVLTARIEALLGAEVKRISSVQTDLVRDQTVVDVRYRLRSVPRGEVGVTAADLASSPGVRRW